MTTALGSFAGLPVPTGHLVQTSPSVLRASKGPILPDGSRLCFASEDVSAPCIAQLYVANNPAVASRLRQKLADMPLVGSMYGFDAWVANIDRHERNLLIGGSRGIYLIDHGHCFTGPSWSAAGLKSDATYDSRLKSWLTPVMTVSQRSARAGEAAMIPGMYDGLNFHALAAANHVSNLLSENDLNALVKFLEDRKAHVARLAADALNMVV
jgi:hypothetical protein